MSYVKGKIVIYGLDRLDEVLENIIRGLNIKEKGFELKLIMVEAVNNAFIHGNKEDKNKPIFLDWKLKNNLLKVNVTDCGNGFKDVSIYRNISEENILKEDGRGIYLIRCFADEVFFIGNSITMKKYVS